MPSFPERSLPAAPEREPDIDDDFNAGLSPERWVASYLPQWTTPERARAHYGIVAAGIELRIDSERSKMLCSSIDAGISLRRTGSNSLMPSTTLMVLVPGWRCMARRL